MTAMQMNSKKLDIITALMDTRDEQIVDRVWTFFIQPAPQPIERIPGLPYTDQECIASVKRGWADICAGRTHSLEEVRARFELL